MARVVGASERAIARKVIWVSLLPFFFTGLRWAPAACGERRYCRRVSGVDRGYRVFDRARPQLSDTTGVFAGNRLFVAGGIVLLINAIVNALERRALRWRPIDRDIRLGALNETSSYIADGKDATAVVSATASSPCWATLALRGRAPLPRTGGYARPLRRSPKPDFKLTDIRFPAGQHDRTRKILCAGVTTNPATPPRSGRELPKQPSMFHPLHRHAGRPIWAR